MKKKILIITLSNIGDAVMTTPVLLHVLKKYKNPVIDLVCDRRSSDLFNYFPNIRNIFLKDKKRGLLSHLKLIKKLRSTKYDIAIDLRTDVLLYFIKAYKKFFKINNDKIHSVEKHFLSYEKKISLIQMPKIYIPEYIDKKMKKYMSRARKKNISLSLGANSQHKIWPLKKYVKLINLLQDKINKIYLLGDEKDKMIADNFEKYVKVETLNLCGKLSIMETAAVIKQSDFFIGNDSGLGHIASAVRTPSFTIFGEGDPNRYKPYGIEAFFYQSKEKDISKINPNDFYYDLSELL